MFEKHKEYVRSVFEQDGYLDPMAVVLATIDPNTGQKIEPSCCPIVPSRIDNDGERDGFAESIKQVARLTKATAVVMFFEAWMLVEASPDEVSAYRKLKDAGGSMEELQNRVETVAIIAETALTSRFWYARITRREGSKPTLGEFETPPGEQLSAVGRFTAFLIPETKVEA